MFDILNIHLKVALITMTALLSWFVYEPIGLLVVYFNAQLLMFRHYCKMVNFELKHSKHILKGTQNIWYTVIFSLVTIYPMTDILEGHVLVMITFLSIVITYISMLLITDLRIRHERITMD